MKRKKKWREIESSLGGNEVLFITTIKNE